ncbi:MAG TPA: hypothetical protein VGS96_23085 [Thermoanaerobaculia bacterium]|jgi:hypothetical protein|nr:hypothetical protein [Thermoanaerobaculia bacterium]
MKILRGALTFIVFVAVFTVAECTKEQTQTTTTTTATSGTMSTAAMSALTTTVTLTCMPSTATLCTDPCIVDVKVHDNDNKVEADKVWLYEGQLVTWKPKPDHAPKPGDNTPKVEEVRFVDNTTTDAGTKKPNDKAHVPANCTASPTDCTMTAKDFTQCKPYNYIVMIHHKNKHKKSDPELEVGSTTQGNTATSATGGTSGTSGTSTIP